MLFSLFFLMNTVSQHFMLIFFAPYNFKLFLASLIYVNNQRIFGIFCLFLFTDRNIMESYQTYANYKEYWELLGQFGKV